MPLASEGGGPVLGPQRAPGPEWVGEMLGMVPHPPFLEGPSLLAPPLPPPLPSTPLGPTWPEGPLDGRGPSLVAHPASRGPSEWGKHPLRFL